MELESGAYYADMLKLHGHTYVMNLIRALYKEYTQLAFRYY